MLRVWHTQTLLTAAEVRAYLAYWGRSARLGRPGVALGRPFTPVKPQCTPRGLERSGRYGWVRTLSPPPGVLTRGKLDPWYHIPSPRTPTEAV
eukprot:scaffold60767_cov55-Phaeocystis_antarctica.AAC.2